MKKIKVNKLIYSLIVSISGLLLSLFVNRGYFIIESVVGAEYKNIMSSEKIENSHTERRSNSETSTGSWRNDW